MAIRLSSKASISLGISLALATAATADTLNVPADFPTIQAAVDAASVGDTILVSPGTWLGLGDSVLNPSNKDLTIQSTDGPEVTILDGQNSRRVVYCTSNETIKTVIAGFTMTNGFTAGNFVYNGGAGVACIESSPTFVNCRIVENHSDSFAGGVLCSHSDAVFKNCDISHNTAVKSGAGVGCWWTNTPSFLDCTITNNTTVGSAAFGGGFFNGINCRANLTNCSIVDNACTYQSGGGVAMDNGGSPVLVGCTITGNSAGPSVLEGGGGGVYCWNVCNPTLIACVISGNHSTKDGGGMYCEDGCSPTIEDCRIEFNHAELRGGGIKCWKSCSPAITKTIISNNTSLDTGGGLDLWMNSLPTLTDCEVSNNQAGTAGGIFGGLAYPILTNTLVCGNSPTQIPGFWEDRGGNDVVDECPTDACSGDFNGDAEVNGGDLGLFLAMWGEAGGDINGDGTTDGADMGLLLAAWGACR